MSHPDHPLDILEDRVVPAGEFKAKCLHLISDVASSGLAIVITKRGKPMARLAPIAEDLPLSLRGSVSYADEKDLLSPVDDIWEAGE